MKLFKLFEDASIDKEGNVIDLSERSLYEMQKEHAAKCEYVIDPNDIQFPYKIRKEMLYNSSIHFPLLHGWTIKQLFEDLRGLVHYYAKRNCAGKYTMDEAIQDGKIAILKALRNEGRDGKIGNFISYVGIYIKSEMMRNREKIDLIKHKRGTKNTTSITSLSSDNNLDWNDDGLVSDVEDDEQLSTHDKTDLQDKHIDIELNDSLSNSIEKAIALTKNEQIMGPSTLSPQQERFLRITYRLRLPLDNPLALQINTDIDKYEEAARVSAREAGATLVGRLFGISKVAVTSKLESALKKIRYILLKNPKLNAKLMEVPEAKPKSTIKPLTEPQPKGPRRLAREV